MKGLLHRFSVVRPGGGDEDSGRGYLERGRRPVRKHGAGRGLRRSRGRRSGWGDEDRLGPAHRVRRTRLLRARIAQVQGVAIEAHARPRVPRQVEYRPGAGDPHGVTVVADRSECRHPLGGGGARPAEEHECNHKRGQASEAMSPGVHHVIS